MHTEEPETDHMQKFNHESVGSILSRIDVSPEKVRYFLEKLHTNKSCGPDQIHVHVNVLKNVTALDIPWSILFNKTRATGYIPQDYKDANITPLFKKGSRTSCNNYRPVSLTSQIVKVLERIILEKLWTILKLTI